MARTVLRRLELANGRRIVAGRTLLFLDEVQACPRAIMALRYFYEQVPELHVIAAGSLLEFVMGDIPVPIGRVQHLYLYPMTFREYLLGMGNEVAADWVVQHPSTVDESLQRTLLNELKTYFFVGGMPESVDVYRKTRSLVAASQAQTEVIG